MKPTKLLIFGNPKAGTPVMLSAPTSAIDLPLKVLGGCRGKRLLCPITVLCIYRNSTACRSFVESLAQEVAEQG